jgi:hypothetical protein
MPGNKSSLFVTSPHCALFLPVLLRRLILFAVFFFAFTGFAQAQDDDAPKGGRRGSRIIDDTTRQVYGPTTSQYYYEEDVFYNREKLYPIDTLIRNFHRYNYVQRYLYTYQDLGNIGTAIQPLFYQPPSVSGYRSGSHQYDLYWDTEPVRYYDTKSPYTNMKVILGGLGRSITRATFSRNINPRWNFGFTFRGLFIDKNIQRKGKSDRLTRGNYYDGYTAYQSKDSTYRIFFNARRSFHRVEEFGGVQQVLGEEDSYKNYFLDNAQPNLTSAESNDLRINYHLFHQYRLGKALQLYHQADRYRQKNSYLDVPGFNPTDFYDAEIIEGDSTHDVVKFKVLRNEMGIKGSLGKLFYNGYYAIRHYNVWYNQLDPDTTSHITNDSLSFPVKGNEYYIGGRMSLHLDSIGTVSAALEAQAFDNYRFHAGIVSRWFDATVTQMRYSPGFFEQAYRGAHDEWNNNFANTLSTQFKGALHYRSSSFNISPGVTFTNLDKYIFYKKVSDVDTVQQVLPVQSTGQQTIFSPQVSVSFTFFRHIIFSGQAIYSKLLKNDDDAISLPDLIVNGQLAYANIFYNGNFDFHGGVDINWRSPYFAQGYDPAIQKFYIQKEFKNPAAPIIDIFINAKVKRGRVFFKYHNLLQMKAITDTGYMPTPYYPGQPNTFEFGFDWSFYD